MLQSGRSVRWATNLLPHSNDCILFSGYCGVDTLGYKIKNFNEQKTINIAGKPVKNRCQIVALKTMSSHMQRNDLINYYKGINTEKICLVHGDMDGKIEFAEDLKQAIADCSKTTKVCVVNKGTTINL
jgi:predicted metal-dependent RNase